MATKTTTTAIPLLQTTATIMIKTTAIPLLQTTAAIMILKPQDQRIHIWHHHSETYYQQPREQLREARLQKDVQNKEYQRLHLEKETLGKTRYLPTKYLCLNG